MSGDDEEYKISPAHLVFLHTAAEAGTSELEKGMKGDAGWPSIVDARGKTALFYAAQTDNLKNCLLLVKKGLSWWSTDRGGDTPMHWATHGGAVKVIKHLLSDTSVTYDPMGRRMFLMKDKEGVTPMHIAAKRASSKILKMFVDAMSGDDIFKLAKDNKDRSPLHYAATYASIECVQLILDEDKLGLPVDQKDCYGLTPLMIAAGENLPQSVEIVRLLVARKPSSISASNKNGQSALHLAVAANNLRVIDTLLELMPKIVESCDSEFRTPLHYAADAGHVEAVEKLLKAGSRNTMKDRFQVTPAHYAAQHSKKALQTLLVHAKLNAVQPRIPSRHDEDEKETVQDIADIDKRTCLMWAVAAGNIECIQYLLSASRPDRAEQDAFGYNALHLAVHMNDEAACRELMRQGWNPNERTKFDMTPLHLAAGRANTPDVIGTLVTHRASLNERDAMGRTPIFMACFGGKAHNLNVMIREFGFEWKVAHRFLKTQHEPVRDAFNRTLLHCAAYSGYSACISTMLLIEEEENYPLIHRLVHWKDKEGETALHAACAEGKTDCVITLISKQADKNALSGNVFPHLYGQPLKTPLQLAIDGRDKRRIAAGEVSIGYDLVIPYLERIWCLRNAYVVRWNAVVSIQRYFRASDHYKKWLRLPVIYSQTREERSGPMEPIPSYWRFTYDFFKTEILPQWRQEMKPQYTVITKKL